MRTGPEVGGSPTDGEPIHELHAEIIRLVRLLKSSTSSAVVPDQSAMLLLWPMLHQGPLRLRDLAESKGVDASTVSRQVAQLVRSGFIRRDPDPDDGRAALLGITDQGRQYCHRLLEARRQIISDALRDWRPERVAALVDLMRDFNFAIEAHQRADVANSIEAPAGVLTQETT